MTIHSVLLKAIPKPENKSTKIWLHCVIFLSAGIKTENVEIKKYFAVKLKRCELPIKFLLRANPKSKIQNRKWRRGQDSNLQALSGGSFQDYCITNYATSP
jgi:hypothetical protein